MTAAAFPADVVPPRPGWRSLLWITPLTLAWMLLIYWQPIISASGFQTTAHQLIAHAFIAVGLWLGLEGAGLTPFVSCGETRPVPSGRAQKPLNQSAFGPNGTSPLMVTRCMMRRKSP